MHTPLFSHAKGSVMDSTSCFEWTLSQLYTSVELLVEVAAFM
jgi:hypothetical protein